MNPNDLLAQQQALLNQVMAQQQHLYWGMLVFWIIGLAVTAWVLYMFYARLRDIANELRNLRLAYEFFNSEQTKSRPNPQSESPLPPRDDARYMPKK